jgi:hypothetical protein
MKKAKLRHRREELNERISDLGLLAAKLDISAETERTFMAALPKRDLREFMNLWRVLHQDYLRFGDQSQA